MDLSYQGPPYKLYGPPHYLLDEPAHVFGHPDSQEPGMIELYYSDPERPYVHLLMPADVAQAIVKQLRAAMRGMKK